jgi:hypothetical protein
MASMPSPNPYYHRVNCLQQLYGVDTLFHKALLWVFHRVIPRRHEDLVRAKRQEDFERRPRAHRYGK